MAPGGDYGQFSGGQPSVQGSTLQMHSARTNGSDPNRLMQSWTVSGGPWLGPPHGPQWAN